MEVVRRQFLLALNDGFRQPPIPQQQSTKAVVNATGVRTGQQHRAIRFFSFLVPSGGIESFGLDELGPVAFGIYLREA
jgi:hypothetical protein